MGDEPLGWDSLDDDERRLVEDVETRGYHILLVPPDGDRSAYAYTIGLTKKLDHPEILIAGLAEEVMVDIVTHLAGEILEGRRYEVQKPVDDVLEGYECLFRRVAGKRYPDYLGFALWYYGQRPFSVLQLVWPDREGHYPWQSKCAVGIRKRQPILDR